MKKINLCVLPLALFLAASSGQNIAQATEHAGDKKCTGDPQAPMVNLNLEGNKIKATPECVRAHKGKIIVFRLTPKNNLELNTVKILPKDDFVDSWLRGKNDDFEDIIIIRVPGEHEPDGTHEYSYHKYTIKTPDKELDPRVEVEH